MSEEWSKVKATQVNRTNRGPGALNARTEKPKNALKTVIRLFRTLSGNVVKLVIALLLIVTSSLAGVAGTWFLKPLLNSLFPGAVLTHFVRSLFIMSIIYTVGALSAYAGNRIMISVAQRATNGIRANLFNHLQSLPISYFDTHAHGELMSRFTNDVDNVNMALEQSLSQTITSLMTVVGTFVMMLVLSPLLTVFIIIMIIVMLLVVKFVGGKSSKCFREQQNSLGALDGYIEEMIEGQKVVKVFNHEEKAQSEFNAGNDILRKASTDAQTYSGVLMPIMGNISYVNYAVTAMVGAILCINGKMDIGTVGAFLQYTRSFSQPITQIANQVNLLLAALAGAERIFDVMDQAVESDDGQTTLVLAKTGQNNELQQIDGDPFADFRTSFVPVISENNKQADIGRQVLAWSSQQPDGSSKLTELRGDVRFQNVIFGYIPNETVLHDVTLFAKPGQKIAFVGSTGAGKTTITNLINRFYEIEQGAITYDGIDIRQIRKSDLRRTLGVVLQDVHLFKGTIRDNIRYGKLNASDEEIERAAKIANADTFISHMPDGYDTMLSPDGSNLSQGQRQLLSIARAAVADPPVLILDEATSSVDTRTEILIERGMDHLMRGRTTFVIAHRLSTVRNSNAIMVLEHGQIIERGDHADLMALHGRYYQLCTGAMELA
jgi:ATP-binding cassette, subfamily B, multidrug efflux pump